MLSRAEAQMVYGSARESHNECARNTLKRHLLTFSYIEQAVNF